jgi:hypothetical protein
MRSLILVSLFAVFMLTACVVSPSPQGYDGVTVSPLPAIVVLDADSYYHQGGYYYYYQNNNWSYSTSRNGPWMQLPRSHWPTEVRYRDRYDDRDRDRYDNRVSPLPAIVVLDADSYYQQGGYYYYYQNNNWRYSTSRNGPWMQLPKSHWPKEIRYRDRGDDRDRDRYEDRNR